MDVELHKYLKDVNFNKQFKNLVKNLHGKSIVIYGAGQLFRIIQENYNLSELNIIGISDMKFSDDDDENQNYLGYKIIPKHKIIDYNPDYVLISTLNYINLVVSYTNLYKDTEIKVKPLVQLPIWKVLWFIWRL